MARKQKQNKDGANPMLERLRAAQTRARRAMQEIQQTEGAFSPETNEWLLEMGYKGDMEAKVMYFGQAMQGYIVGCDWLLMEKWANEVLQQNKQHGYFMLGGLYFPGAPGYADAEKAYMYYMLGAEAGSPDCKDMLQEMDAMLYGEEEEQDEYNEHMLRLIELQEEQNYKEARKELKLWLRDEPQNVDALLQMAAYYVRGLGVTKSYKKALEYYKLAADQGAAEALYFLGDMYQNGSGCVQNREMAFSCFKKAVQQKYPPAYFKLGVCYRLGLGVEMNIKKACATFKKGAGMHNPECYVALAAECIDSPESDIAQARRYLKAARRYAEEDDEYVQGKIAVLERLLAAVGKEQ